MTQLNENKIYNAWILQNSCQTLNENSDKRTLILKWIEVINQGLIDDKSKQFQEMAQIHTVSSNDSVPGGNKPLPEATWQHIMS